MNAAVVGTGAVGSRVGRQLQSTTQLESLVLVDQDLIQAEEVALSLGTPARATTVGTMRWEGARQRLARLFEGLDTIVLASPSGHAGCAEVALDAGCHVVSVSDDLETVQDLLALDAVARKANRSLVVGAGFSPGLSCLLAKHAAERLDTCDEIHVAKFGTGGPACARQHHKALRSDTLEWRDGGWESRRGGSGRDLAWFPDPVGGLDCYRAALPEPLLLLPAFPGLTRASARVSATRRDRSTKWLPMLRRPHPEGLIGALRVEVRGTTGTLRDVEILGALDRPAVAAGTVAAIAACWAKDGLFTRRGAGGLAELVADTTVFLTTLSGLGVKAAVFEGESAS